MIADHLEPKGLLPDAESIGGNYELVDRESAERGSKNLLDAIFRSIGIDPPPSPPKIRPRQISRRAAHIPEACPHCGAPAKPRGLMIAHIQHAVAAYYDIHPLTMTSARRAISISHPRQIAMYLASELTPKSLPEIGRRFGGRDHTTVIHAIKAVKRRMETDPEILLDVEVLKERLAA